MRKLNQWEEDQSRNTIEVAGRSWRFSWLQSKCITLFFCYIQRKLSIITFIHRRIPKRKYEDTEGSGSGVLHSRRASSIDPFAPSPSNKERELKLAIELKRLENEALERKAAAAMRRLEFEVAAEDRRRQAEHNDKRAAEKHELMMKMVVVAGMAMGGQPTSIPP